MFDSLETIGNALKKYIIPPIVNIIVYDYYLSKHSLDELGNLKHLFHMIKNNSKFNLSQIYRKIDTNNVFLDKLNNFWEKIDNIYFSELNKKRINSYYDEYESYSEYTSVENTLMAHCNNGVYIVLFVWSELGYPIERGYAKLYGSNDFFSLIKQTYSDTDLKEQLEFMYYDLIEN
jgi:hypothetical protein